MSRRKFLHEINKMTRKGVYPSLKILLEEDEENKDDSSSDSSGDDSMGGDDPFGDEDEGGDEGGGNTVQTPDGPVEDIPDDEGLSKADEIGVKIDQLNNSVMQLKTSLDIKQNETPLESEFSIGPYGIYHSSPNRSDESRLVKTGLEKFILISEDSSNTDKLKKDLKDAEALLQDNEDFIKDIGVSAEKVKSGIPIDIENMVRLAVHDYNHFDKLHDPLDIVKSIYLRDIRLKAEPSDVKNLQKKFEGELEDKINNMENNSYNSAVGAKSQS